VKPQLLLIDNYDSFTYNLVQAFLVLGAEVHVYRNDAIDIGGGALRSRPRTCASRRDPARRVGRGRVDGHDPRFRRRIPVLGVCLGHQSIVEVFGGKVVRAGAADARQDLAHRARRRTLFAGLPSRARWVATTR
jgi:anthranilate/para-aminobenzoate synthase component II